MSSRLFDSNELVSESSQKSIPSSSSSSSSSSSEPRGGSHLGLGDGSQDDSSSGMNSIPHSRPNAPQPKGKPIPRKKLTVEDLFDARGLPQLGLLRNHMKEEGRLSEAGALKILRDTTTLLTKVCFVDLNLLIVFCCMNSTLRNQIFSSSYQNFIELFS